jgi:hypothetical protein
VVATWTLLGVSGMFVPGLGAPAATSLGFGGAALLAIAAYRKWWRRSDPLRLGLACASGFAGYPAWIAGISALGLGLGLAPRAPLASGNLDVLAWSSLVVLAPVFEEIVYRAQLLPALRARYGVVPALLLSSALFAAPHLEPWTVLGTFLVGLALGGLFVRTEDLGVCIAAHAGLNAAVLTCGSPPTRVALDPWTALLAGSSLSMVVLSVRVAPASRMRAQAGHV